MVNYFGAYIRGVFIQPWHCSITQCYSYSSALIFHMLRSRQKPILTVYTTLGNKVEAVPVTVCYINVLYMLPYHTVWTIVTSFDRQALSFLIYSLAMSLILDFKCVTLVEMIWLWTSIYVDDLLIPPHLILVAEIINAISRDQIANQRATSWLLMWLPHLHWIPTQSEKVVLPLA